MYNLKMIVSYVIIVCMYGLCGQGKDNGCRFFSFYHVALRMELRSSELVPAPLPMKTSHEPCAHNFKCNSFSIKSVT